MVRQVESYNRLAKEYHVVARTTNEDAENSANAENEPRNECTISVNEYKTQTPYRMQVQVILNEFADVFLKDLLVGLPP